VAKRKDLTVFQANNEGLDLAITDETSGAAQDLTAKTLHLLIKTSQLTADSDMTTITLTSAGLNPPIVIDTDPVTGLATVTIPYSDLTGAANLWWRLDVVEDHKTVFYGDFTVLGV
jgi:hypothetical protein